MTFSVGWEEWVALPDLAIPGVRAKIDTGAQTSSLHAFSVHPFRKNQADYIRFGLHPLPERPEIEIFCEAELIGQREITSSNGETELRPIIRTHARLGDRLWPIEISLTNRETMSYRMLLGRRALEDGILVDVTRSCIQGSLDLSVYDDLPHVHAADRPLRIALLHGAPGLAICERIIEAAQARGHEIHALDVNRCYMSVEQGQLRAHLNGEALPRFDIALPWLTATDLVYGLALLRQFETSGIRSLNNSAALAACWDRLHASQKLARRAIPQPDMGFANATDSNAHLVKLLGGAPLMLKILEGSEDRGAVIVDTRKAAQSVLAAMRGLRAHILVQNYIAQANGAALRCFVLGRKIHASLLLQPDPEGKSPLSQGDISPRRAVKARPTALERKIASKAVSALGLQAAVVDLVRSDAGPLVVDVDPICDLEQFETVTGLDLAAALIGHLEDRSGRNGRH
ncbi:ribosomal protein S6 modification protein [alpha proteobacterium Q-1]|nr:RimK family alpha-L-glutamate ligase [Iodidimonas nitroreducens]GAK34834.1 ribosomal protein S6 modification protein [alpha proteobacterium Q-1]